jgi:DNA-binding response OmpR family regulator
MINILLIEDNPGDVRIIRELLREANGASVALVCADRLSSGIQQLTEGGVDLVLLDLTLPDSKGLETLTKMRAAAKGLPVILLTGLDDEELAVKAVREGAEDYIVKGSVSAQTLARAIRFAVERHKTKVDRSQRRRSTPGKVVAFVGAKGGVGTTTVALNSAAVLSQQHKSVLTLELSSFNHSFSQRTQQNPARNLSQLLDLETELITEAEIDACMVSLPFGVNAIFAPQQPGEFRQILPAQAEEIIHCASHMADYLIVDLPSHPSTVNQAVVRTCDIVALVLERNPSGVAVGKAAVELLTQWGVPETSLACVVVVKDATSAFIPPAELATRLRCPVAGVIPPAVEVSAQSRVGTPFSIFEPESILVANLVRQAEQSGRAVAAPL